MSKALSVDLRERVVAAVAAGASCRAAATRFGVRASSAIRWCAMAQEAGSVAPGPLGGDRRSARLEAHAALILDLLEQLPAWFENYNAVHPHSGLRMLSPREFIAQQSATQAACLV